MVIFWQRWWRLKRSDLLLYENTSIILTHNHPSGNLTPSDADLKITKRIKDACKLMDINIVDHLIIINSDYYSFADNGNV